MRLTVNDLSFHLLDEGSGPPVLLLHGFPDSSALWRHQVPALVEAGHRVIAPDLRGFGASDRPEGVECYAMPQLVSDVLGMLDALEVPRACVVGHDWGAALGWALAGLAPQRVDRLAVLSVGHPAGYFGDSMRQRAMSWYMLFFQFTGVAERGLSHHDWALLRAWLRGAVDLERYIADLSRPGALTAALNWYRANIGPQAFAAEAFAADQPSLPSASCPVLGIWSDRDFACGEDQMTGSQRYVTGPWRYERITGAGHWIPLDAPDTLSKLLVEYAA